MTAEQPPSVRALALAAGIAAGVLLVAVLPAEYGLDPTGLGQRLGLLALGAPPADRATGLHDFLESAPPATPVRRENLTFELGPFESVEYKYELNTGEGLLYSWHSSGEVLVNFHGERSPAAAVSDPANGSPDGAATAFNNGRARANHGVFVAPFAGRHGWFFQNRGAAPITVALQTVGFFDRAIDYRGGFPFEKAVPAPKP